MINIGEHLDWTYHAECCKNLEGEQIMRIPQDRMYDFLA